MSASNKAVRACSNQPASTGLCRRRVNPLAVAALATAVLGVGLITPPAVLAQAFVVEDIRVEGLRRLSPGAVFNALPIAINDTVDEDAVAAAIRALFRSGFFQDVSIARDGNVLVVEVVERPAIATIELFGNSVIESDRLLESLRGIGLAEGESFDSAALESVRDELRALYLGRGNYNAEITTTISPLPLNRVSLRIDIDEGETARIRDIQFVGNEAFSDRQLNRIVELGPKPWYLPLSQRDRYSREALTADIDRVLRAYRDAGYVSADVTSTQVSLTPSRDGIIVTVNIDEGRQYRFGEVTLLGDMVVPQEELEALLTISEGSMFSQQALIESVEAIRDRLGEAGYAFAAIDSVPELREDEGVANLTFFIDPGSRVYVRRINISGNQRTDDEVIRREFRQMEGGWFSNERIRTSRTRLNQLGFFDQVEIEPRQVAGEADQVDLDVTVQEGLSGSFQAGVGYGSGSGFLIDISLSQDNLLGSGDRLDLVASRTDDSRVYRFDYTDRYYTIDGVTRHISGGLEESNLSRLDLIDYRLETLSGRVGLGYPISEFDRVRLDLGVEDITLSPGSDAPAFVTDFATQYGRDFVDYSVVGSWRRNTTDRRTFPNSGSIQDLNAQVALPGGDLTYYKADYSQRRYFDLPGDHTLSLLGRASYGDGYGDFDTFPFLQNYFVGGPRSVRGFRISSLGPQDERGRAIGGNVRINGSVEWFFPVPMAEAPAVRLSTFVDGGQVFDSDVESVDLANLRYSAGLGFVWMSPVGPLTISRAWPINEEPEDRLDRFQFSIGTVF